MLIHLSAQSHMVLRRLLPVAPMAITCLEGGLLVTYRGFERRLHAGAGFIVPAFQSVDLHLEGRACRAAQSTLDMSTPVHLVERGPLGERLARHVFFEPAKTWSAATFSALTGLPELRIRRTLFSEGAALTEICRNQRLMCLLFGLLQGGEPLWKLLRRVGWPPASDVEAVFYDRFGVTIDAARSLAAVPSGRLRRRQEGLAYPSMHVVHI
ncbi:hypothetical protein [Cupriavidus sp. 2SB]|uniref:hypothetical protein n=1 Tax=Cupriavidus sp. 2SB TaxID=2502199 RepID=UPI0010F8038B|nr:hypothetical protein [Cupriavidus sp. 2SB]